MANKLLKLEIWAFLGILLLSSCKLGIITGKKFQLDLVKVQKEKPKFFEKKMPAELENKELILASTEANFASFSQAEKRVFTKKSNIIQPTSSHYLEKESGGKKQIPSTAPVPKEETPKEEKKEWDWASITSFTVGLVGLLSFTLGVLFVFGLFALVFGIIGLNRTAKGKRKGRGLAIAGTIIGIVPAILFALLLIYIFAALSTFQ